MRLRTRFPRKDHGLGVGVDVPWLDQNPTAGLPSLPRMGSGIKGEVSPVSHHARTAQQAHHRLQLVIDETGKFAGEPQLQRLARSSLKSYA